jgi:6-hydroxy-3-succinoylpyridine 3-monooxygenase
VNLALHACKDALQDGIENIVFVTNDTDIAPAVAMIRQCAPKVLIGLVIPTTDGQRRPNVALKEYAHWTRNSIKTEELMQAQLPRVIPHKKSAIVKPDSWYANPTFLKEALALGERKGKTRSAVFRWLDTANDHYQGKTPLEILESDGGMCVVEYLRSCS